MVKVRITLVLLVLCSKKFVHVQQQVYLTLKIVLNLDKKRRPYRAAVYWHARWTDKLLEDGFRLQVVFPLFGQIPLYDFKVENVRYKNLPVSFHGKQNLLTLMCKLYQIFPFQNILQSMTLIMQPCWINQIESTIGTN